jgi:hypothetical protein
MYDWNFCVELHIIGGIMVNGRSASRLPNSPPNICVKVTYRKK